MSKYILKNWYFKADHNNFGKEQLVYKIIKETYDKNEILEYVKELLEEFGDKKLDYHIGVNLYKILDFYNIEVINENKKVSFSVEEFYERNK